MLYYISYNIMLPFELLQEIQSTPQTKQYVNYQYIILDVNHYQYQHLTNMN